MFDNADIPCFLLNVANKTSLERGSRPFPVVEFLREAFTGGNLRSRLACRDLKAEGKAQ